MKVLGPYLNNCNRLFVRIGENGNYITKSYPKYLMEEKLGRPLEPNEDVHHIDGNPLNNDLSNLEIRIHGEHQKEHSLKYPEKIILECSWCHNKFVASKVQRYQYCENYKKNYFCSHKCAGKFGRNEQLRRNAMIECE